MVTALNPKRGEIWLVNLNHTVGSEINKVRPAVVISTDFVRNFPVRLVVPITEWKPKHFKRAWVTRIEPSRSNGLEKESAADPLQTRCVSIDRQRFVRSIGFLEAGLFANVVAGLEIVTEIR